MSTVKLIATIKSTTSDRARHAANVRWGNEQALPESEFSKKEDAAIHTLASRVFKANKKAFEKNDFEFSITVHSSNGVARLGKLVVGDEAEATFDDDKDVVAVIHSHPNGSTELSSWDMDTGSKVATKTGRQFRIYVMGFEDDAVSMGHEDFFPADNDEDTDGDARRKQLLSNAYEDYLKNFKTSQRTPKPMSLEEFERVW